MVERESAKVSLTLLVTPLIMKDYSDSNKELEPAVMIFIGENDQLLQLSPGVLTSLFNFTPAEIRLATALAHGFSIEQIAEKYDMSKHTLRVQVKSIFKKTGVSRQPELMKVLLTGPCRVFNSL